MRALELVGFKSPLQVSEKKLGELPNGYARIRMESNGICATDVKMVDGAGFHPDLPFTPGHEPAGVVESVSSGHEKDLSMQGKHVVIHPHVACGMCENCITGNENVCLHMQASYGINTNGGMQEYLDVPLRNLVVLPDDMPMDMGALAGGVVAVPLRGIKQLGNVLGKRVLVLGTGGLAFAAIQILHSLGAEVITVGRKEKKLEIAREIGSSHVFYGGDNDYVGEIRDLTDGLGVHAAVDLAGANSEVPKLLQTLRRNGKLLIVGYSAKSLELPYNRIALDGLSVIGTRSYTRNDLAESVGLISSGKCKPIISRTFPLEEANDALEQVRTGESVGRVLIHPNE